MYIGFDIITSIFTDNLFFYFSLHETNYFSFRHDINYNMLIFLYLHLNQLFYIYVTVAECFVLHKIIFLYIKIQKKTKTKRKANGTFTESSVVYSFHYIIHVLFSNSRFI